MFCLSLAQTAEARGETGSLIPSKGLSNNYESDLFTPTVCVYVTHLEKENETL